MVSMKDIAKATGFGVSTVSLVLGNRGDQVRIKQETQRKIFNAARELGYCRNELAAEMQSGRSRTLAVLLPKTAGNYFAEALLRASEVATSSGYFLKMFFFSPEDPPESLLPQVISQRPAAILSIDDLGPRFELLYDYAERYQIPTASIDFDSPSADFNVLSDDSHGIREVISHFVAHGHRRIGYLTSSMKAQFSQRRYDLYCEAMREHGFAPDDNLLFYNFDQGDRKQVIAYVRRILDMNDPPTAIACSSDYLALTLMMALSMQGIRIPDDLSIAGYGNIDFVDKCMPRLTTVLQPWNELAETAVKAMVKKLSGEASEKRIFLPTTLIQGDSVAKPHTK